MSKGNYTFGDTVAENTNAEEFSQFPSEQFTRTPPHTQSDRERSSRNYDLNIRTCIEDYNTFMMYGNLEEYMLRHKPVEEKLKRKANDFRCYNCFVNIFITVILIGGLIIGAVYLDLYLTRTSDNVNKRLSAHHIEQFEHLKSPKARPSHHQDIDSAHNDSKAVNLNTKNPFHAVSFTGNEGHRYNKDVYPKNLTEHMRDILKDDKGSIKGNSIRINVANINTTKFVPNHQTVVFNNVFWGPKVEDSMPQGYGANIAEVWERYVGNSQVVKMEIGCGRMQNRLVTFKDGIQACVRYRQNTDQIQGEIFSFYVGRLLNLTNLAPSVVKVIDVKDKLWATVANDIAAAKWNSNRAVVLTQYIPSLESATIPDIFKPSNRHLNKLDVLNMSMKENDTQSKEILIEKLKFKKGKKNEFNSKKFDHIDMNLSKKMVNKFVELAQWSDLIIFDYLTANLDRIVNNLFNYQWNANIMDGPAHNLARKMDSGLLIFLDNESGLLHGYRLLKKYNVYHSLMLDNLCVFRQSTVNALRSIYESKSIGAKLSEVFHMKNNAVIRDILPPLPEKNAKVLQERIGHVLSQIEKCEQNFSSS